MSFIILLANRNVCHEVKNICIILFTFIYLFIENPWETIMLPSNVINKCQFRVEITYVTET